jgi:hypothetical protein
MIAADWTQIKQDGLTEYARGLCDLVDGVEK